MKAREAFHDERNGRSDISTSPARNVEYYARPCICIWPLVPSRLPILPSSPRATRACRMVPSKSEHDICKVPHDLLPLHSRCTRPVRRCAMKLLNQDITNAYRIRRVGLADLVRHTRTGVAYVALQKLPGCDRGSQHVVTYL